MRSERCLGLVLVAVAAIGALLAQLNQPLEQPPLYDGVVVTEPYVWLDPPMFSAGGATGASATVAVQGTQSPIVAVATDELPPQAQLLATPGALTLHAGARSIQVAIDPVPPPAPPPVGFIDGNVYEFRVIDDAGRPISAPPETEVTVVLRSADPNRTDATIVRFDGTAWVPLQTDASGLGLFFATVSEFGDFAVQVDGASPYATAAPTVAPPTAAPTAAPPTAGPVQTESGGSAGPATTPGTQPEPGASNGGVPLLAWIIGGVLVLVAAVVAVLVLLQRREDRRRGW